MKKFARVISTIAAFGALSLAVPATAHAQIANNYGVTLTSAQLNQPVVISFNGLSDGTVYAGLTSQLTLTLTGLSGNSATFGYSIFNNSSYDSTVTGFGFQIDPNFTGISIGAGSVFAKYDVNGAFPTNGLDDPTVELCLINKKTCQGAGSGSVGVLDGTTGTGSFTLTFASAVTSLDMGNFIVRYQGVEGPLGPGGSAVGIPVNIPGVPEPATWAMMLLGFGLAGSTIRRRRNQLVQAIA